MTSLRIQPIAWLLLGVALFGCARDVKPGRATAKARGRITYQGDPVAYGLIMFYDAEDNDVAVAKIESDGTFVVKYQGGVQIPVGEYKVTVGGEPSSEPQSAPADGEMSTPVEKPDSPVPEKFGDDKTSGLTVTIEDKAENELVLELED